jgi:hypothetical protein
MTETQERFLRAVLERVAVDSVVELHLFPSIRRGTLETGVAVIATEVPAMPQLVRETDELQDVAVVSELDTAEGLAAHADGDDDVQEAPVALTENDDDSPYAHDDADVVAPTAGASESSEASDELVDDDELRNGREQQAAPRLRILTASYRSTIKGPERGKWSVEILDEAIAPLDAIEAVLRGVRHRSTEPADPELIGHEELASLVAPVTIAPAA